MKILLAVDGSDYTHRMLEYVATHRAWLGADAQVTVLTVVAAVPPRAAAVLAPEVLTGYYDDSAEAVLAPVRSFLAEKGIAATLKRRVGHAAEEIAREATEAGADLIVMGSHGHGTISSMVMGSVTTKVLAHCKTPVLLIR
jgi:nucleotide-binding universal stress UspA family protein